MKTIVALLSLVAIVFAQSPGSTTLRYAGTTVGSQTWTVPVVTSGACAAGTNTATYQAFNLNVSAAAGTFYAMRVMFENAFIPGAEVFLYHGFAPSAPCTGFQFVFTHSGYVPPVDEFIFAPQGNYTVVVTGSDSGTGYEGIFAANLIAADATGTTAGSTGMWYPPYSDYNDLASCSNTGYASLYKTYTWTATKTYIADINVYMANASYSSFYVGAAVYSGTYPPVGWSGIIDACNGSFISSAYDTGNFYATVTVALTAGQAYTVAFSGDGSDYVGYYGVSIEPSINKDTSNSSLWSAPTVPAYSVVTTCTDSGDTKHYDPTIITAEYPTYIVDVQSGFDTASVLYYGNNVGNPPTTLPTTCTNFLIAGDTGDGGPLAIQGVIVGINYTIIVTGYSSGYGHYNLYALTGVQLGTIPSNGTSGVSSTTVSSTTVSSTTVSSTGEQQCDTAAAAVCATDYSNCVSGKTTLAEICPCYATYGACLNNAYCLTGTALDAFIQTCETAGCSSSQCNGALGTSASGNGKSSPATTVTVSFGMIAVALIAMFF